MRALSPVAARIGPAASPFSKWRRSRNTGSSVAALSGNSQPRLVRINMTFAPLVPAGPIFFRVIAEQLAAPAGHEALDARRERVRHRDLDRVDRLQQDRVAFRQSFLDRLAAGGLERHVGAVDGVELTGEQNDRQIDDRKAERAVL